MPRKLVDAARNLKEVAASVYDAPEGTFRKQRGVRKTNLGPRYRAHNADVGRLWIRCGSLAVVSNSRRAQSTQKNWISSSQSR